MAVDELAAARLRRALEGRALTVEKRMFGGLAFMVRGSMCVGLQGDTLMVRVGPARHDELLAHPHARPMDFTGRPMKGYLFVDLPGWSGARLDRWLEACLAFNAGLPEK